MFQFTPEQHRQLEELKARPKFSYHSATRPAGKDPGTDAGYKCKIVDVLTGVTFAEGRGASEKAALIEAIAEAQHAERPATPGQVIAENRTLKDEIALKDKELAELKAALESVKPKGKGKPKDVAPAENE